MAASGKRDREGIKAHASSTVVSAITKFMSAATFYEFEKNAEINSKKRCEDWLCSIREKGSITYSSHPYLQSRVVLTHPRRRFPFEK